MSDPLLASDVAQRYGVTVACVYNWIKRDLLAARKFGRDWLIQPDALDGFTLPTLGRPRKERMAK